MTTVALLTFLQSLDVKLWVEDDRLRYRAPKGVLTPMLRTELMAHKEEILALLRSDLESTSSKEELPPFILQPSSLPRDNEWPLSFAQQRLWFLDQLENGSPFYNVPVALRWQGMLNVKALEQSVNEIVRRHEALRTTFPGIEGRPVQRISPALQIGLPVVDLMALSEPQREGQIQRLAAEEHVAPFNLAQGPLLRVCLLRASREEYVVLLSMHHIVSDGWSVNVLLRELIAHYLAFSHGSPSTLPALPIQYPDYALWQRQWLSDEVLEAQLSYWKAQLRGAPFVLNLPTDRPRPAVLTYSGARHVFTVPGALLDELNMLSQREEVTLFMTLLSAWQVLLGRYSGQDDLLVGTPIANRSNAHLENLIGFFVNTLVLRGDMGGDPSFRTFLSWVREVCLGAYAHQDLPFEQLVEALQSRRDLSRAPLFQVIFILQNMPAETFELPGMRLRPLDSERTTAKFDLSLSLRRVASGLLGVIEYNTDLFDAVTIAGMAAHWLTLLEGVVADPEQPLSHLPLLTQSEQRQLLAKWNVTRQEEQEELCLHQLFEEQVRRSPEAIAIVCEGEQLTYQELNRRANQLAHHLQSLGVRPEMRVGLRLPRSLDLVVAVLGILKAGGAYVPLDLDAPTDRLAYMVHTAQLHLLLTQTPLQLYPQDDTITLLSSRHLWQTVGEQAATNPTVALSSANLAYIVYTSGSTGRPRGVLSTHRGAVNFLRGLLQLYHLRPEMVVLQIPPLSFDASVRDIFGTLLAGGRLVMMQQGDVKDPNGILKLLRQQQVTHLLSIVPSFLRILLATAEGANAFVPSLRLLLTSGEPLPLSMVARARSVFSPQMEVVNQYGPTEATMTTTYYRVPADVNLAGREAESALSGHPIPNMYVYLLDQQFRPVPPGVAGEVYLGGVGVARGYLGQADVTAAKFLPSPFSFRSGERLYRTGDLARFRPNNVLEYLGRLDQQMKIRGNRVEPGEIERLLESFAGIKQAIVLGREEQPGEIQLVASLLVEPGQALPEPKALRNYLQRYVPDYMQPARFVVLEDVPLTPHGKLDRKALAELKVVELKGEDFFVEPRTPIEEVVAVLWADLLRRERVGIHDNFFELGGHSLLATQVISRMRDVFKQEIPLRLLFEAPTIAGLLQRIEQLVPEDLALSIPPLLPMPRDELVPLSYAQQRLWFLDQLEPVTSTYNLPVVIRLQGELNLAALEQSVAEIIRRHEVLRTRFALVRGQAVQIIAPSISLPLSLVDVSGLAAPEREGLTHDLIHQETRRPFDLARGPLLRVGVLRLRAQEHVLHLTMHHSISDGWSLVVLLRELSVLYQAFAQGRPSPLTPLPVQYADYTLWQRSWLQGEVLEAHQAYWRQHLAEPPQALALPADRPRPLVQSRRGASYFFMLPSQLSGELVEVSRREGVTLFMTLLAAFAILLFRYSGQEDLVIGTPIANRLHGSLEDLIGFFINTLALRLDLSGNPGVQQLLRRIRQVTLEAYTHQNLPFEQVVEALQPERMLNQAPLFQVLFVLQNTAAPTLELPGLHTLVQGVESGTARFDLTLSFRESPTGLRGVLEYSTDLFEAATIQRLAVHLQRILEGIVAHPQQTVMQLPLLTKPEQEQLLFEWNTASTGNSQNWCIHTFFEAQVERTPDAVAVTFEDEQLSYLELNRRANRLAHHLQSLGVGPDMLVGIALERSLEMIIGVLAILKAGGAFVPLDLTYPAERLSFLLSDSRMSLLITQEHVRARLPVTEARILYLESVGPALAGWNEANPVSPVVFQHLAYVIYTSGSTGRPKGVMVAHHSLCNLARAQSAAFGTRPGERILQFASLSFDASISEIVMTLGSGATLCLARQETLIPGSAFLRLLREQAITIMTLPPSVLSVLPDERLPTVQTVISAGEACSAELAETWSASHRFINAYGPTETTVCATVSVYTSAASEKRPTIGRPIANTQAYVLDAYLQPVPIGVCGELYIAGEGLARGYLHRADWTAERFIPHPFSNQPGARLYRTGDLTRYRPNGTIEFLGRRDGQLKLRGYRIELGEIEVTLQAHPFVRDAVVVAREDIPGQKRLVAYLVLHQTGTSSMNDLRTFVKEKLPGYLVPSSFVPLERLPQTSSGKVDRRALAMQEDYRPEQEVTSLAPQTELERAIAGIWQDILRVEQVGIHDTFFDLGGHSLLLVRVQSSLRDVLDKEITLIDLFRFPTVSSLARYFTQQQEEAHSFQSAHDRVAIRRTAVQQRKQWRQQQVEKGQQNTHHGKH